MVCGKRQGARAVAETGIRVVLTVGGMDSWSPGFPLPPSMIHDNPTKWALEASERLITGMAASTGGCAAATASVFS